MIGVAVHSTERDIAGEFFELFKTPWEFYRVGQRYDVVVGTQEPCGGAEAKLVLLYTVERLSFDLEKEVVGKIHPGGAVLFHAGRSLPLYGPAATFSASRFSALKETNTGEPMAFLGESNAGEVLRIGYNLFQEVRRLLTVGQPSVNARTATLELHIALMRDLITRAGLPLVEIPPVPDGYHFMACLTHDLDHPVLRNHCCDHTMFGFLYRATLGSLFHACRGRTTARTLCRNWFAAAKLPFVYLGMARDPWRTFDRYLEIEAGLGSTYFVIPKKDHPGRQVDEAGRVRRASRYTVDEIKPQLEKVVSAGNEVALHGLDAWLDSTEGNEEQEEITRSIGTNKSGVRIHWLCFNEHSPAVLDRANFSYDSTVGYNETVGYRAGTTQAYRPLGAVNLLELPLHIMDTALFYPCFLNLDEEGAWQVVRGMVKDMDDFGGVLTINWHDRSIAPERLWDGFYRKLIAELKANGAWFPTASKATAWFKMRRSVSFDEVQHDRDKVRLSISANDEPALPGLKVRIYRPQSRKLSETVAPDSSAKYVEVGFKTSLETCIALST